ncbi:YfiR family protein [Shewanella sp. WXL01]|uniref:YfiR family protein n=1 Tax=Shewanella sp. WXL01 TaxID=2709721 RepID=UPI001FD925D4|nr:YfiR family protein [Shewanella sp. WXL01]
MAITLMCGAAIPSVQASDKEYAIKAGFLYNFALYGRWSSSFTERDNFVICSQDHNFIAIANRVLGDRNVKHKPITTQTISQSSASIQQCDMFFVSANTQENWPTINHQQHQNTMFIGETEHFIKQGGHIRFFLASGKIRFEISPKHLKQSGLSMSSKVLRLGRVVER